MKALKNKLRDRTGASMLIALAFMLFCVFIGGSVLVAATANSARLQRTVEDDQDYLMLRSAAALLIDELRPITRNGTQMSILVDTSEVFPENEDDDPELKTTMAYNLRDNRNELRELAYLCAACQYCRTHNIFCDDVDYSAFTNHNQDPKWITDVLTKGNNTQSDIVLSLPLDGTTHSLNARVVCSSDYDISVFFLTPENKISSRLHVEMSPSYLDTSDGMLNVIWDAPVIAKGGETA